MRKFLVGAVMLGAAASGAQAADMPDFLRGSIPGVQTSRPRNWDGWYVGGEVGYTSANTNMSSSLTGITNTIYENSTLEGPTSQLTALGNANTQGTGFGAFVGRNYQWDDIVLGIEAKYNYFQNLKSSSASSVGPLDISNQISATDTAVYAVTVGGNATVAIHDAIAFRGRAGWAVGDFLPYAFGGLAVGRMDVTRHVVTTTTRRDDITTTSTDQFGDTITTTTTGTPGTVASQTTGPAGISQGRSNNFVAGWTGGIGGEYALWGGLFLRGEWEYMKFMSVMNTSVTLNSVHAGIGYKF